VSTELVPSPTASSPAPRPVFQVALFTPTPKAARRVLEFFTAQIDNYHTRKAYLNATRLFAEWCDAYKIGRLAGVHPFHLAAFIKYLQGEFSPPTLRQPGVGRVLARTAPRLRKLAPNALLRGAARPRPRSNRPAEGV